MKIKKIFGIILILICFTGCTNINLMTYDEILNNLSTKSMTANNYRKGFSLYVPKGLHIENGGPNYLIFSSANVNYYLYVDFISYDKGTEITYEENENAYYAKKINNNGFYGYLEINLWKNNQYLIEIMYNYAKIEVMVDKEYINNVLINSINILKSIRYNDTIISSLLEDDSLDYTEEIFDLFKDVSNNSNVLEHEDVTDEEKQEEIKDTDYIN